MGGASMTRRLRWLLLVLLLQAALLAVVYGTHSFVPIPRPLPPRVPQLPTAGNFTVLDRFVFEDPSSLKIWEEKIFKGKTNYNVLSENGQHFLKCISKDASSGLYVKVDYDPRPGLCVSWKWRALKFPQKKHPEMLSNRAEDDFAARVYVLFPASNFFRSDVIEYIWDERFPAGTAMDSPYTDRVKLFVIRSGPAAADNGGWQTEERDIYEDFVKLFDRKPSKALGAVALMSDSDNTGTDSEADFADITLKLKNSTLNPKGVKS